MSSARSAYAELDRDRIERIVESARESLREDYDAAATPRFPFGIHHACARSRVREPITRRYLKQHEISALLAEWALEHGGAEPYAWQSVALATEELIAEGATPAAERLLARAERVLRRTPPFLDWMKNRLIAAKSTRV
jgi:hypothetical protein